MIVLHQIYTTYNYIDIYVEIRGKHKLHITNRINIYTKLNKLFFNNFYSNAFYTKHVLIEFKIANFYHKVSNYL